MSVLVRNFVQTAAHYMVPFKQGLSRIESLPSLFFFIFFSNFQEVQAFSYIISLARWQEMEVEQEETREGRFKACQGTQELQLGEAISESMEDKQAGDFGGSATLSLLLLGAGFSRWKATVYITRACWAWVLSGQAVISQRRGSCECALKGSMGSVCLLLGLERTCQNALPSLQL